MKKKNYGYLLFISPSLFFHGAFASNNQTSSVNKDWSGLYVGAKAGIISSKFKTNTTTNSGTLLNNLSAKLVNQVGQQEIDNTGFLSGVVGGYNWIFNKLLIGLEANIQSSSTNGESHTGAIPYPDANGQYVITSYGNSNWLFTASPRVGLLSDNWLFYTTAGFALANVQSDFIFTDSLGVLESKRVKKNKPGYLVGAGIETNLTSQISLNTEYVFTSFAPSDAADMNQTIPAGQYFTNNSSMHANSVSMGLNYHFSPLAKPHTVAWINPENWQSEVGGRVFFSTGNDGAPQPLLNSSNFGDQLASRLIFSGLSAITEEVFARFEHLNGMFIKGYLGAGTVRGGQLNDEDFPAPVVYSNTLSNVRGNTSYFTLDLG